MKHKTKKLTIHDGLSVEIDEKLYNLIRLMWISGIETNACCQEYESIKGPIINFKTIGDLSRFIVLHEKAVEKKDPKGWSPLVVISCGRKLYKEGYAAVFDDDLIELIENVIRGSSYND